MTQQLDDTKQLAIQLIAKQIKAKRNEAGLIEAAHMQPDCTFDDNGAAVRYHRLCDEIRALEQYCCRSMDEAEALRQALKRFELDENQSMLMAKIHAVLAPKQRVAG